MMKKKFAILVAAIISFAPMASAQFSLGKIFGDNSVLGNVIEGVFTKSNLTISDLVGEYKADGPAVSFKSENFLKKAGGIAASAALESKLQPYYNKLGIDNLQLVINPDSTFSMKVKGLTLSGNVTSNTKDGTFEFNFKAFNRVQLGSMTAYIQKSINTVDVMFDATKLKNFLASIAQILPVKTLKTVGSLLESYDGACIGAKMLRTGNNSAISNQQSQPVSSGDSSQKKSTTQQTVENGMSILRGVLNNNKK